MRATEIIGGICGQPAERHENVCFARIAPNQLPLNKAQVGPDLPFMPGAGCARCRPTAVIRLAARAASRLRQTGHRWHPAARSGTPRPAPRTKLPLLAHSDLPGSGLHRKFVARLRRPPPPCRYHAAGRKKVGANRPMESCKLDCRNRTFADFSASTKARRAPVAQT